MQGPSQTWGQQAGYNGCVGTWGIPRMCMPLMGLPVIAVWGFGLHTRAVWMAVCLCPSAWQEGRQPLLRAWFGYHCCQEKEAPSCQHNHLCFLHPPCLMWQLSAYCFSQCQSNHHGVGQLKSGETRRRCLVTQPWEGDLVTEVCLGDFDARTLL